MPATPDEVEAFEAEPGRLDAVVARLSGAPRADVQRAIGEGAVLVNGRARPKSFRLEGGERIEARLDAVRILEPEGPPIPVRFEDDDLLVVAKPAGLVTHPTPSRRTGSVVNRLLGMGVPLAGTGDPLRPGMVHRLDVGTSGLLLVAKSERARDGLTAQFRTHEIERTYLALVRGEPANDSFAVEAPLGRRSARIVVDRTEGRRARTDFEVRERLGAWTLLEVRPATGRTHQIRVHAASVGHPVAGDRRYGGGGAPARRLGLDRPFLHSWRLVFDHPVTGARIELEEPLPSELDRALADVRS